MPRHRKPDPLPPVIKVRSLPKQLGAALTSDDLFAIKAKLGEAMALVCELIGRQNARENRKMKR